MGDKTQLLAMAFATKYKTSKVMCGVLAATALNHAAAVAAGAAINRLDSVQIWIQAAASLAFILFGIWTLRGDSLNGERKPAREIRAGHDSGKLLINPGSVQD